MSDEHDEPPDEPTPDAPDEELIVHEEIPFETVSMEIEPNVTRLVTEAAVHVPYQAAGPASKLGYLFFVGLVFLIAGLLWWRIEQETSTLLVIWLFLSAVAVLSPVAWHAVDIGQAVATRRGAAFGFVTVTIVLGCVVLVAVSAANYTMHDKGRLAHWDLTGTGEYSVSDETVELFREIEGTVYCMYLKHGAGTPAGVRYRAIEQLRLYDQKFTNFEFQELDPVRYPVESRKRMSEWGVTKPTAGEVIDLIVITYAEPDREVQRGQFKEVRVDQFEWQGISALGDQEWRGERIISRAVKEMVFARIKAYVVGGHGEESFDEGFRQVREKISAENIELVRKPLDLVTAPKVPSDCRLLFVLHPRSTFQSVEAEAISNWLGEGNTLFLVLDTAQEKRDLGLETLLASYGMYPWLNYMVYAPLYQEDPGGGRIEIAGINNVIFPGSREYSDHPSVRALKAGHGQRTFFVFSAFIELAENPPEGIEIDAVVTAPDLGNIRGAGQDAKAIAVPNTLERGKVTAGIPGTDKMNVPLPLVVVAKRELPARAGTETRAARLIVTADTDVFRDSSVQKNQPNRDLFAGLLQWGIAREGLVSISAETVTRSTVRMNPRRQRIALWIPVGVSLLPLILGAAVWWGRRR